MPPVRVAGTRTITTAASAMALLAALAAGCQQNAASRDASPAVAAAPSDEGQRGDAKVVNNLCPIGEDPVHIDGHPVALTRTFQGQTVGFCCEGCVEYWDAMTDEAKAEEMAELAAEGHAPGFTPG